MSKTPEQKVAEQLTNLTEDHWFNAASLARYLTDQPYYTTDRIMELVAQIIKWGGRRHEDELTPSGIYESNTSSEGLFLANELSKTLDRLTKNYKWENLKLPVDAKKVIDKLPKVAEQDYRYSWIHDTDNRTKVTIDHPFL
jgi:hypothetical protein